MRFRQKFLGYTGGLMVIFGLALVLLGPQMSLLQKNATEDRPTNAADNTVVNGAAGISMWTGLVIIMAGLANLTESFEKSSQKGYYQLPFSVTVLFANFIALVMATVCISLLSWSLHSVYLQPAVMPNTIHEGILGMYSTIIVAACIILILALMAMFVDCCVYGFLGPSDPPVIDMREPVHDAYNRGLPMQFKQ